MIRLTSIGIAILLGSLSGVSSFANNVNHQRAGVSTSKTASSTLLFGGKNSVPMFVGMRASFGNGKTDPPRIIKHTTDSYFLQSHIPLFLNLNNLAAILMHDPHTIYITLHRCVLGAYLRRWLHCYETYEYRMQHPSVATVVSCWKKNELFQRRIQARLL